MQQKVIQLLAEVKLKMKKMETENLYYLTTDWIQLNAQKALLEYLLSLDNNIK